jgi:uncharacterized protein (DUF58 family)
MVVLLSDFLSTGWEQELCDLGRRHDVIAIRISDPKSRNLPNLGLLSVEDPETYLQMAVPTNSGTFTDAWTGWHKDRADLWFKLCRRAGAAHLELSVEEDASAVLTRFFTGRGGQ